MVENIYRYLAIQHREVVEHKYYLSEKAGCTVSLNDTYMDWLSHTNAADFLKKYDDNHIMIDKFCDKQCGRDICSGLEKCVADLSEIHKILHD